MLSKSKVRLRINIKKVLTNEYPDLSYMKILAKCFACYLVNRKKNETYKNIFQCAALTLQQSNSKKNSVIRTPNTEQ